MCYNFGNEVARASQLYSVQQPLPGPTASEEEKVSASLRNGCFELVTARASGLEHFLARFGKVEIITLSGETVLVRGGKENEC